MGEPVKNGTDKRLTRLESWQELFDARLKKTEELCDKISDIDLLRQAWEDYKTLQDERLENINNQFTQMNGTMEKVDKNVGKMGKALIGLLIAIIVVLLGAIVTVALKG